MEPVLKKKVGSILEALEAAACNTFNMQEMENEIANMLAPIEGGLPRKENISTKDEDQPVIVGKNFSFVPKREELIPGLSLLQEDEHYIKRENSSFTGGYYHGVRFAGGSTFSTRETYDRARGGIYRGRRGRDAEHKKSVPRDDSAEREGAAGSSRIDSDRGRGGSDGEQRKYEPRTDSNERGSRGFGDGSRKEGGFDRGRAGSGGDYRKYEPRSDSNERGGRDSSSGSTSSNTRGFDRERGGSDADHRNFDPRGDPNKRGGRDFSSGSTSSNTRGFDRGRGDGDQRRYVPRGSSVERGGRGFGGGFGAGFGDVSRRGGRGGPGFGNRRAGGTGHRGMRRRKMTPEEEEAAYQRMLERDAIAERAIMIAGGQLPPDP